MSVVLNASDQAFAYPDHRDRRAMNLLEHSIRNKIDRGIVKRVLSSSSDAQVVANAFTSLTSLIEMFSVSSIHY